MDVFVEQRIKRREEARSLSSIQDSPLFLHADDLPTCTLECPSQPGISKTLKPSHHLQSLPAIRDEYERKVK